MKDNNKGNVAIIVLMATIVIIVITGVAVFLWMNRPVAQINKSIEEGNVEKVVELYPKLSKADDIENVQDEMLELCKDLCSEYENGNEDYDKVIGQYELLEQNILSDEPALAKLKERVEEIEKSRKAFADAEKAFAAEDYEMALEAYEQVSSLDKNYANAQKRITECKELLVPAIVGKWSCEFDVADYVMALIGMDSADDLDLKMPVSLDMVFNEDGTGQLSFDANNMKIAAALFFDQFIDILIEQMAQQTGMTVEEYDKMARQFYGMSFKEYINSNMDYSQMMEQFEETKSDFSYEVNDSEVILDMGDGSTERIMINGDELILQDTAETYDWQMNQMLSDILPLTFKKQ